MRDVIERLTRTGAIVVAVSFLVPVHARADRDLEEKVLEKRHKHGDYGVYFGIHDPWDAQFDERDLGISDAGTLAYPVGFKMRWRMNDWLRVEGEASYYRRGERTSPFLTVLAAPRFDGLMLAGAAEASLRRSGLLRPYVGGGVVAVSLSRDLVVDLANAIPELEESSNPDRFQLGSWKEADLGFLACAGIDVRLGKRVFPFVEYRHLFGEAGIDKINVGGFEYAPETLGVPSVYDFSGPLFMFGLKVHF